MLRPGGPGRHRDPRGSLASLKRFKDDAREVAENYECGLTVEKFNDIKEGDIIEAFTMEEIPAVMCWA